jgi:hypothetical protein
MGKPNIKGPTPVVIIMDDPIINAATIMPVVKRLEEFSNVLTSLSNLSR